MDEVQKGRRADEMQGKKSIARLYAEFLYSMGVVSENGFHRSISIDRGCTLDSDEPLPHGYSKRALSVRPSYLHPFFRPKLKGQILFFDITADFPGNDWDDPFIFDRVSEHARDYCLIISTKNEKLLERLEGSEKILEIFQCALRLPDYNEAELKQLLARIVEKKELAFDKNAERSGLETMVRRVAQKRNTRFFLNTHALQQELDDACKRQALRLARTQQRLYSEWFRERPTKHGFVTTSAPVNSEIDRKTLLLEDIIAPKTRFVESENVSLKKLQDMVGLASVKEECSKLFKYAQINHEMELLGKSTSKVNLNRLFLGPPGVGKTTVAQLYGQFIIDLGLVSGNKVLLHTPDNFIGPFIGHSEAKTSDLLRRAKGNVLIIDDAHMLFPNNKGSTNKTDAFGTAVLDTIAANVSAEPEDRCIIIIGYEHEMQQLFLNSNSGLQRRFPSETALRFEPYTEDELCQILDRQLEDTELNLSQEARAVSRRVLHRMMRNPKFGNAGDVGNLLGQAQIRLQAEAGSSHESISKLLTSDKSILKPWHFDPDWDRTSRAKEAQSALFEGFVGFNSIKQQFQSYHDLVVGMRLHRLDPDPHIPWSFVFTGPPGTGKTSTARKVGRLYYDLNLLSSEEVMIHSVTDLVGMGGDTGRQVINILDSALGKVLFIDEAYRLALNSSSAMFYREAVGELVDAMTQTRYAQKLVVILAGYTKEMELLLGINPGLRSRFPTRLAFPHMSPQVCLEHLSNKVRQQKIQILLPDEASDGGRKIYRLLSKLSGTKGWANGRDIETLARSIVGAVYMREGRLGKTEGSGPLTVATDELIVHLQEMLKEREGLHEREAEERDPQTLEGISNILCTRPE